MKDKTVYTCTYKSKLGDILLAADAIGLTGLWFEGQKYFANTLPDGAISQESLILTEAKRWLDIYFSGKEPVVPREPPYLVKAWRTLATVRVLLSVAASTTIAIP